MDAVRARKAVAFSTHLAGALIGALLVVWLFGVPKIGARGLVVGYMLGLLTANYRHTGHLMRFNDSWTKGE